MKKVRIKKISEKSEIFFPHTNQWNLDLYKIYYLMIV